MIFFVYRLAVNEKQYLSGIMQIRDLRHKRRLIIKATDVVLFGPPQRMWNKVTKIFFTIEFTPNRYTQCDQRYDSDLGFVHLHGGVCLRLYSSSENSGEHECDAERAWDASASGRRSDGRVRQVRSSVKVPFELVIDPLLLEWRRWRVNCKTRRKSIEDC